MFEQSLVETGHTVGTRKPVSMLASLGVQVGVVSLLVLIPLLRSAVMPATGQTTPLTVPLAEAVAPPVAATAVATRPAATRLFDSQLTPLPTLAQPPIQIADATPAAAPAWLGNATPGTGTLAQPINIPLPVTQPASAPVPEKPLPVGGEVEAARCLVCSPPAYPAFARQARIEGAVELQAEISPQGAVTSLRRLSGNALLAAAAEQAVRAWRYQPLLLDGRPVAVTTVITVHFRLH